MLRRSAPTFGRYLLVRHPAPAGGDTLHDDMHREAAAALRRAGHQVKVTDLARVASRTADLGEEKSKLQWAEVVVVNAPLECGFQLPQPLKEWCDDVAAAADTGAPKKVLLGVTTTSPSEAFASHRVRGGLRGVTRPLLRTVNTSGTLAAVAPYVVCGAATAEPTDKAHEMAAWRARLLTVGAERTPMPQTIGCA